RLVIEAMQRSLRGDLGKILVALFVLGQHQEVVVRVALGWSALGAMVILFADVKFAADDWLDSGLVRRIDEVHCADEVPVVSRGHGGHAQFFDAIDELFYITSSVEHGIVGMEMEMDELRHV